MNLPNKITIARILLVPIMMLMPYIGITAKTSFGLPIVNIIILIIFLVASFTDYLDGHIARKRNIVTNFGKFLDPIADKLLVLAALVMLVATEGKVIAASKLGKIKTVTQMVAISLAFLDTNYFMSFVCGALTGFALILNILMSVAMILAVIATIWSGVDYFMKSKDVVLQSK